jgi:hypothetical protein
MDFICIWGVPKPYTIYVKRSSKIENFNLTVLHQMQKDAKHTGWVIATIWGILNGYS